jgi:hypothetical protein
MLKRVLPYQIIKMLFLWPLFVVLLNSFPQHDCFAAFLLRNIESFSPSSGVNSSPVTLSISGLNIGSANVQAKLRGESGSEIIGTIHHIFDSGTTPSSDDHDMIIASFDLTGAVAGPYRLRLVFPSGSVFSSDESIVADTTFGVDEGSVSLKIDTVWPNNAWANNNLRLSVYGSGFTNDSTVFLTKAGQPEIQGTSVNLIHPGKLECLFDFSNKVPGDWTVVVRNATGSKQKWNGNGHYYAKMEQALKWGQAKMAAAAMGGYLATVTSAAENKWLTDTFGGSDGSELTLCWIGGFQAGESEADEGWQWVTGEPWSYSSWGEGEPNDLSNYDEVGENVLSFDHITSDEGKNWNDLCDLETGWSYLVEYNSDPDGPTCLKENGFKIKAGNFEVSSITPANGGDTGFRTVTLIGSGLQSGMIVKLQKTGEEDIIAERIGGIETYYDFGISTQMVSALFNLIGKAHGKWDLVVENPDASYGVLENAFSIEAGKRPQVTAHLFGREFIRTNRENAYHVCLVSNGNVDAGGITVFHGLPADCSFQIIGFSASRAAANDPSRINGFTRIGSDIFLPSLIIPGTVYIDISINTPTNSTFDFNVGWLEQSGVTQPEP